MKRVFHLFAGVCWFLASFIFAFFLLDYIATGAGLQFFPLGISSGRILLGVVHVTGFMAGAVIFFSLAAYSCAQAIVGSAKLCAVTSTSTGAKFPPAAPE